SFVTDKKFEKKKLYKSNPCKNRFCPVCAWRKARKDALGLSLMMQYIKQEEDKQFIFLTLTTPNVTDEHVTGISEITQVHVQKIKQNSNKELYEMAKYSGKDSDYLINQKVFDAFYKSLKGKQILVYSGLFKDARNKLKNGDLDYLKDIDPTEYI
uniref:protein rep n=1 Tax=Staphylococcus hominis TaxID=1290 RepID=UPI0015C32AD9